MLLCGFYVYLHVKHHPLCFHLHFTHILLHFMFDCTYHHSYVHLVFPINASFTCHLLIQALHRPVIHTDQITMSYRMYSCTNGATTAFVIGTSVTLLHLKLASADSKVWFIKSKASCSCILLLGNITEDKGRYIVSWS